jgi:DNA (cytosine-5)-methyltransferase 1
MKPKLLDLFCCAGGAGTGYSRAGFDVYGVDIDPQPRYPFPFHLGDALDVLRRLLRGEAIAFTAPGGSVVMLSLNDFAAIHTSPPCQFFSITSRAHSVEHPDLLEPTRQALRESGKPYVIENVEGAPLVNPLRLCGSEFRLRAEDVDGLPLALRRHRLFESNMWLMGAGGCSHDDTQVAGSYKASRHRTPEQRDNPARRGGYTPALPVRAALLGIDWPMNEHELAQSIPPAYTEFIGHQLIEQVSRVLA